jgi:hypothetical protein
VQKLLNINFNIENSMKLKKNCWVSGGHAFDIVEKAINDQ